MPYYDFECQDCKHIMTVKASIEEIEKGKTFLCENCNSKNTKRYFQPIAIASNQNKPKEFQGCGEHCSCFPDS